MVAKRDDVESEMFRCRDSTRCRRRREISMITLRYAVYALRARSRNVTLARAYREAQRYVKTVFDAIRSLMLPPLHASPLRC